MEKILLLTDELSRGERLASSLSSFGPCTVVDILDPAHEIACLDVGHVGVVVSDVSFAASPTIGALRRQLKRFGATEPTYLCLLHEDTARGRAQAQALGAVRTLPADQARHLLPKMLTLVGVPAVGPTGPDGVAEDFIRADAALVGIFASGRSGRVLAPATTAAAADLIERALSQSDIRGWLDVVWQFDDATHQHCLLVAGLAAAFGRQLRLNQADCQRLTQAALLHDVGKSRIPLDILNKPGRLSPEETAVMREHPAVGYAMLLGHGYAEIMLAVVRSHHEYLDGSGYPDGLAGAAIPDLVRLVTICDIFGALIERRPYKAPMPGEDAYAILAGMAGKLDMDLVRAFRPIAAVTGAAGAKCPA